MLIWLTGLSWINKEMRKKKKLVEMTQIQLCLGKITQLKITWMK